MRRITNLLRTNLRKTHTLRAGVPGWDRPDPPPTVKV